MRKFKSRPFGHECDLDNQKTYSHLPNNLKELDNLMFREIGYALVYMDYFSDRKHMFPTKKKKKIMVKHTNGKSYDHNNAGYDQRQRINKLIQNFADNRHLNYKNKKWYKEQIFMFQDECENLC